MLFGKLFCILEPVMSMICAASRYFVRIKMKTVIRFTKLKHNT